MSMSYHVYWVKNRVEKIADFEHPTLQGLKPSETSPLGRLKPSETLLKPPYRVLISPDSNTKIGSVVIPAKNVA